MQNKMMCEIIYDSHQCSALIIKANQTKFAAPLC